AVTRRTGVFPGDSGGLSYLLPVTPVEDQMSKALIHWLMVFMTSLCLMQPALAAESTTSPLVGVQWLEKNLKRDDVLLIDASFARMHAAGHIPGSVNVDVFSFGGRQL